MKFAYAVILSAVLFSYGALARTATWKVFVYIEASDGLADMAIKNLTDMTRGKPCKQVEWLVQLHAYDNTALRYQVSSAGLQFLEQVQLSGNSKQDCCDALSWAFADTHADYTMLIFSNHGWGILDPVWNTQTQEWQADNDGLSNTCIIKRSCADTPTQHAQHKAFMFTVEPRTYLSNEDLITCLQYTQEQLLQGNKLDIVAFDTCMGNMLEIGYQLAPHARVLVGSQSCSLRDGFDYYRIVQRVSRAHHPFKIAWDMVHVFDNYYSAHDTSGIYTHAALYLERTPPIREALDATIDTCMQLPHARALLRNARNESPRFCLWPMYTDLVAFWQAVDEQLHPENCSAEALACKAAIQRLRTAVKNCVIAQCAGDTARNDAHGTAVYLPTQSVYASYRNTSFARESRWTALLDFMDETKDARED
jgi:hypothetical protein